MWHFVSDFVETSVGAIPKIETSLKIQDLAGSVRARLGISRDRYRVAPGLYSVGRPGADSPVLVTANYKLSFDSLRQELASVDAWILVLDTRGVNVWCAAGKKTFSTEEVIRQVKRVGLDSVVSHRELILPQLGAPGVSSRAVKKGCGFKVTWGPIRARDLPEFLTNGRKAETKMRQLTFTIGERMVLIPVELSLILKPSLVILLALFLLSGINPDIFSLSAAWFRGLNGAVAYLLGILAGAVFVPILLPWLPMRQFYIKGLLTGLVGGILVNFFLATDISRLESLTLVLLTTAVSSYAAMNFTGATPFTSPSGVEKEMRQGIPIQIIAVTTAIIAWVAAPFVN
ncbi:MAG: hypothetical protein AMJ61_11460 [Desulfobacterales bacterium SG8_35_2]|nr:MAG: hypothetical protein AMJ61_11460 [Desulfobacterales bacterium SG8_35_2]